MDSLAAIQKAADLLRSTYWAILLGLIAVLIAYMGLGPTPLDSKVIAWLVVGALGGSFLLPYSTYWYISARVNRFNEEQKNVAGQS